MAAVPTDPDPHDDASWGLAGEESPLAMRFGGEPVGAEEALGVARRFQRASRNFARQRGKPEDELPLMPVEIPLPEAKAVPAAYRLPPRLLMLARAKAEMEGRTVTDVVTEALEGYTTSSPGARPMWRTPRV